MYLPRYRGTFVSRALMGSVTGWCDREPRIRSILAQVPRVNVHAREYLGRFGFKYGDDETAPGLVCMRRRICQFAATQFTYFQRQPDAGLHSHSWPRLMRQQNDKIQAEKT